MGTIKGRVCAQISGISPDSGHVESVEEVLNVGVGGWLEGVRVLQFQNSPGHGLDDVGVALLDVDERLAELRHRRRIRRPTFELAELDKTLSVPFLQQNTNQCPKLILVASS